MSKKSSEKERERKKKQERNGQRERGRLTTLAVVANLVILTVHGEVVSVSTDESTVGVTGQHFSGAVRRNVSVHGHTLNLVHSTTCYQIKNTEIQKLTMLVSNYEEQKNEETAIVFCI